MSKRKIKLVCVPTLFLSGLADQLIPPRMMKDLYQVGSDYLLLKHLYLRIYQLT